MRKRKVKSPDPAGKKYRRASMTVEAAFVVPMVLTVIFLLISLDFFVHERAWHTLAACEAVLTGSSAGRKEIGQGKTETSAVLSLLLRSDPLPMAKTEYSTGFASKEASARVEGSVNLLLVPGAWEYQAEVQLKRMHPTELLRTVRAAGALLRDTGQGFSESAGGG